MPNTYDTTPYPTGAQSRLHIEHLQLCAALNGFSPAPAREARVLEIGCGTGFNLGPMAADFPEARFVGIDSAATAIARGREAMETLGLRNIELLAADLRDVAEAGAVAGLEQFDYVIAHGVYSWVPEDVREALWALMRRVLAPAGVFHLSYSALPGWHAVRAVRDFAGFLAGDRTRPFEALDATWDALGVFAEHAETEHPFAAEAFRIRKRTKGVLLHDELSAECEPFYLTDVVHRAGREGFRYAGEAGRPTPADLRRYADVARKVLELSGGDSLLCLQLLDFAAMRRFHDTLFVRTEHEPVKRSVESLLLDCWARSDIRFVEVDSSGGRAYEHSGGVRLVSAHPMLCALADALEAASPGSVLLREFLSEWTRNSGASGAEIEGQLAHLALKLIEAAAIQIHPREIPVARTVGAYPRVSAFARMQMARERSAPNLYHASMSVDEPWGRALLTLLDGTRNHEDLARALTDLTWREITGETDGTPKYGLAEGSVFRDRPELAASPETLQAYYRESLGEVLEELCGKAYLLPAGEPA